MPAPPGCSKLGRLLAAAVLVVVALGLITRVNLSQFPAQPQDAPAPEVRHAPSTGKAQVLQGLRQVLKQDVQHGLAVIHRTAPLPPGRSVWGAVYAGRGGRVHALVP